MAQRGRVLDDGTQRMEFVTTAADSDGELHEMRVTWAPQSPLPPPHLHPAQDEHFAVLEGELRFVIDGQEHTVAAGEVIDVTRGCVHQVRNAGDVPAVALWQTRPALRTGELFEALAAARRSGDLGDLLAVLAEYSDCIALADQPAR